MLLRKYQPYALWMTVLACTTICQVVEGSAQTNHLLAANGRSVAECQPRPVATLRGETGTKTTTSSVSTKLSPIVDQTNKATPGRQSDRKFPIREMPQNTDGMESRDVDLVRENALATKLELNGASRPLNQCRVQDDKEH